VGYEANAAVIAYVAENRLGCKVKLKNLDEQVSWQGFSTGEVDAVVENWGHPDLVKKFITDQKVAQDAGLTGNVGKIGWYVPPFMVKQYPDILDGKNLNKYASLFKTSESGNKGQILDGDPGFVTNDAALVKNLKLDYKVVFSGSGGGPDPELPPGRGDQEADDRVLLRAAVVHHGGATEEGEPAGLQARL